MSGHRLKACPEKGQEEIIQIDLDAVLVLFVGVSSHFTPNMKANIPLTMHFRRFELSRTLGYLFDVKAGRYWNRHQSRGGSQFCIPPRDFKSAEIHGHIKTAILAFCLSHLSIKSIAALHVCRAHVTSLQEIPVLVGFCFWRGSEKASGFSSPLCMFVMNVFPGSW